MGTVPADHIVRAKISFHPGLRSDGAVLTPLQGDSIEADTTGRERVKLIDADTDDRNPKVNAGDLGGQASNGFAHGINRVLRPLDLP